MADQIRFSDGAAYEALMGKWSQLAGSLFLDWLAHVQACDGSTSVAATAHLQSCLLSDLRQSRFMVSIRLKASSSLREHDLRRER